MSINLKLDAIFKTNKMYFLKIKNCNIINVTFDKLHKQSKLH